MTTVYVTVRTGPSLNTVHGYLSPAGCIPRIGDGFSINNGDGGRWRVKDVHWNVGDALTGGRGEPAMWVDLLVEPATDTIADKGQALEDAAYAEHKAAGREETS